METIEKYLNEKGEKIWVRCSSNNNDYNLTLSKNLIEEVNPETDEFFVSSKTEWEHLSISEYNDIFNNFELLDTNRNLPPFPDNYKLKDKTYFLRYIQSNQISNRTEDYNYINNLLLMLKKPLTIKELKKIELIEEQLFNKLIETSKNIELAIKFHKTINYSGKIPNISFDGVNGALNKALIKKYGFKLKQDELSYVHQIINKQKKKGLSRYKKI